MFLKGMIIGLFVGAMLGFLAAGLMVAAREAEGIGEDEGAMMACDHKSYTHHEFEKALRAYGKTFSHASGGSPYEFEDFLNHEKSHGEVDHG